MLPQTTLIECTTSLLHGYTQLCTEGVDSIVISSEVVGHHHWTLL